MRIVGFSGLVILAGCASAPPPATAPSTEPSPAASASSGTPAVAPPADTSAASTPFSDPLPTAPPPASPDPPPVASTAPTAPPSPPEPKASPAEIKACAARGGKMEPVCMLGNLECVIRFRDGGKKCSDKKDCIGECLYEGSGPPPTSHAVGVCQRTSDPCGCKSPIVGGKVGPGICVD